MIAWRLDAQIAAGGHEHRAAPEWSTDGLPYCSTGCPLYGATRCTASGRRPENMCMPVLEQMAAMLSAGPK